MQKCVDPRIAEKITKLEEELGTINRQTGRNYFLLVVPISSDEEVTASLNGKPSFPDYDDLGTLQDLVTVMLRRRREEETRML